MIVKFAIVAMIAALTAIFATGTLAAAYADESETETEQLIKQKNVCSGWAVCVNEALNAEESSIAIQ
jgi:hypothetical protein